MKKGFRGTKLLKTTVGETYKRMFYPKIELLSEIEKAYLAGIIDGEGTISICFHRDKRGNTIMLKPVLAITNYSNALLEWMESKGLKREAKGIRVQINSFASYQILKIVLPFLKVKREQCLLLMKFIEKRKAKKETASPYSVEEIEIVNRIWELNKRQREPKRLKLEDSTYGIYRLRMG